MATILKMLKPIFVWGIILKILKQELLLKSHCMEAKHWEVLHNLYRRVSYPFQPFIIRCARTFNINSECVRTCKINTKIILITDK